MLCNTSYTHELLLSLSINLVFNCLKYLNINLKRMHIVNGNVLALFELQRFVILILRKSVCNIYSCGLWNF